jgi:nucleoside-diphosphate-sugar epimerase
MKTLLFTGSNGFLGKNIIPVLKTKKYDVVTLDINNADVNCNLSSEILNMKKYDIIFHAAGKAHSVPKTELEKKYFYDVNYQGTVNLCKSLENSGLPESIIFISTVAVYGCDYGNGITEEHPLNGNTPYALSKIMAEEYLTEWCKRNNIILAILRPSLLAGPNPPGNLGAMINGIKKGRYLSIAGGKARKSILMVQDIANLVPLLVEKGGIYNISDDEYPSFKQLESLISKQLNKRAPISIPYWLAKGMATGGDLLGNRIPINSDKLAKMTKSLMFSNEKVKETLGWKPLNILENFTIS